MAFRFCLAALLLLAACSDDVPIGPNQSQSGDAGDDADAAVVDAAAEVGADAGDAVGAVADAKAQPDAPPEAAPEVAAEVLPDTQPDIVIDPCAGKSCDDKNLCTVDSCAAGACLHAASLGPCSDNNACTLGDTCSGGACLPGAVTACSDGLACTLDTCSPVSGCASAVDLSQCDDGDACTLENCTSAGCAHAPAPSGCDDANPCTTDACSNSACIHTYAPGDGCCQTDIDAILMCDDSNACTIEYCLNHLCRHATPPIGCCTKKAECDDGVTCTTDICMVSSGAMTGTCSYVTAPGCIICEPESCNDNNACTTDTCTPTGLCQHAPISPCCLDKSDCDDGNACTIDACIGKQCVVADAAVGTACGNGGWCDGQGSCVPSAPAGMVLIPSGTFWMGCNSVKDANCSDNEKPHHKVTLSAYAVDLTEATVAQYKACVDAGGCTEPSTMQPFATATYPGLTNHPVNFINWYQARQYCQWRGTGYDLPTEAQWEMAARGNCEMNGSTGGDPACAAAMRTYPWGEATATCSYAVMYDGSADGCGWSATWDVAAKPAGDSPFGLHDMAGNVWEWTRGLDLVAEPWQAQTDPTASGQGARRGGGFANNAVSIRAGVYGKDLPTESAVQLGARCIRAWP